MQDYEKLGVFYLGKEYDLAAKVTGDNLVLYPSKDLVTHAVCVGMTGSGKTGLCLTLLEEAAIDGIPALIIDPKGDLANLLLTFPDLSGERLRPWVNEDEARKKGLHPDAYAHQQAEHWKKGLADWGQPLDRYRLLHDGADLAVYTPGSSAGLPISILKSFDPPSNETLGDPETFKDAVVGTVSSLLGLLGIDADPFQSKEYILLARLFTDAWKQGQALDLAGLIRAIPRPPFDRIGEMLLESLFPEKERFALAMRLNNLLASPGFEAWLEGEPLDIDNLLYSPRGKPRHAIFSIAHLSDAERMFFVSLLLNRTLGWLRAQPGTTTLRALLYMDEIFGYFPPTANPPSKKPLLTLMKQARAFGLGIVLATQNPVDLDYKGLANAGTWFLGRLQTERDKARVLDGLEGAAAGQAGAFDRQAMERMLAGLGNRVFVLNNVNEDRPVVFQVRWALSYLAGPMTRQQIKTLMQPRRAAAGKDAGAAGPAELAVAPPVAKAAPPSASVGSDGKTLESRPVLPPEVPQHFLPVRSAAPAGAGLLYRPMLLGRAAVLIEDAKAGVREERELTYLVPIQDQAVVVDWDHASQVDVEPAELSRDAVPGAAFEALPAAAGKAKNYEAWKKSMVDWLYRTCRVGLYRCKKPSLASKPGETERDFRVRLQVAMHEEKDALREKLLTQFGPKQRALEERLRKAQQAVERKSAQSRTSTVASVFSFGQSVLGAVLGRKKVSATTVSRAGTAVNRASKAWKDTGEVGRAVETVEAVKRQLADLNAEFTERMNREVNTLDAMHAELDTLELKPKKSNIRVNLLTLAWRPYWHVGNQMRPAL